MAPDNTQLLSLRGVSKHYPLATTHSRRLSQLWAMLRQRPVQEVYRALDNVSMSVEPGRSLGLIGVNGAGKSTLMKVMAGVVTPTHGTVQVRGRVGALLELGAGFHPEYSGRENIYLASALMGQSRAQTEAQIDSILSFADIGSHIDQPVKHYSSGMVVRLGFAVATSVRPDVLITDEVLAVGDESFQKKCMAWMERFLDQGGTLVLCSHSMYHIQKLCEQAAWIHEGRLHDLGPAADVTRRYLAWHEERARAEKAPSDLQASLAAEQAGFYQVKAMYLNGVDSTDPVLLQPRGSLRVSGAVHSPDGRVPQVAVGVVRADGTPIYGVVSEMDGYTLKLAGDSLYHYELVFTDLPLLPGRYVARSHAMDPEGMRLFDHVERAFEVAGHSRELGYVHLTHTWA